MRINHIPLGLLAASALAMPAVAQQPVLGDDGERAIQSNPSNIVLAPRGTCGTGVTQAVQFLGGNGQNGNMFDISVTGGDMTIECLDINHDDGLGNFFDLNVYSVPVTCIGNETNMAAWTLVATATGVESQGAGVPTPVDISGNGVTFTGGQTYGLYVFIEGGDTSIDYTNGGPTTYIGDDCDLTTQYGAFGPWGGTFFPREWNGNLYTATGPAAPFFEESFDAGIPGGFTLTNLNMDPATLGWVAESGNFADPGVEHEDESGGHTAHSAMDTPDIDLSGATSAYMHFESITFWANYQANHPSSLGDGYSNVEVSTDGGATYTTGFWVDTQTASGTAAPVDLDISAYVGSATTRLRFEYFGTFAHNWGVNRLIVNDDPNTPPPPPPPPTAWPNVNLPTSFTDVSMGFWENFEAGAGALQPNMATTSYDPVTMLEPDPDGWCNVGQQGAMLGTPFDGNYSLEMGLVASPTSNHFIQNSLVLGLNGGGVSAHTLDFQCIDLGDEVHPIDGVWVSPNGTDWYFVADIQGGGSWEARNVADLSLGFLDLSGDFYLMFGQEDNFPYNGLDGLGIDAIDINGGAPPPGMTLTLNGTCPGNGTADITNATPNAYIRFAVGSAGMTTMPMGFPCAGTVFDLSGASLAGSVWADGSGNASLARYATPQICGMSMQAMDMSNCEVSNVEVF